MDLASNTVQSLQLFINGAFVDAKSGQTFNTHNPGNGDVISTIAEARAEDIDEAVRAAAAAFPAWQRKSGSVRSKLLLKLAQLVESNAAELARLESLDAGKPIRDSRRIDVVTVVDMLEYFAGMATKIQGDTIAVPGPYYNMVVREPLGVIGGIIPWNYPLIQAVGKIAPALACGNTIVIKPAEQACMSVMLLAKLIAEAGFPKGVVNIVPGFGATAGDALVKHPSVAKIMFTGDTVTGRSIASNAGKALKPVALELGGKTAMMVFEDADPESTAALAAASILSNQGQVCTAASRLLVHKSLHDKVLAKVIEHAANVKLGDQMDEATTMGPLISAKQKQRVLDFIDEGNRTAKLVYGGSEFPASLSKGHFVGPAIFDEVPPTARIAQEEIFGPVLSVITFADEAEALKIANNSLYGLGASIVTKDVGRAMRAAQAVQAGNVWINTWGAVAAGSPYGGYKASGFGREQGFAVVRELTQEKSIWISMR